MNYSRSENDILCTEEGKPAFKVAVIDKNGDLRMAKNQSDHREAVEEFLKASGALIEDEDPAIPPCPEEDPAAGDKTPAVIAWWFEHHPEKAIKKYGHRKGTNITGAVRSDAYDSSDRDADIARAISMHDEE